MTNRPSLSILPFLILAACVPAPPGEEPTPPYVEPLSLDLDDPVDAEFAFLKTRGSLEEGAETYFYWTGSIFAQQDVDPFAAPDSNFPGPILRFEGFNVARITPTDDGLRMVSREMAVYQDLDGDVIDCWWNGATGTDSPRYVRVAHVWNDPVNFTIGAPDHDELGDHVVWTTEVMLNYASPLSVDDYPEYSASNTYQAAEMFNWYTRRADLEDPTLDSVPVQISWDRVGQFLPWMQAGQTEGRLLYHTRGRKLPGGYDDLPEHLREYVEAQDPSFAHAPSQDLGPNMTSWRVFKQRLDSGDYVPTCD